MIGRRSRYLHGSAWQLGTMVAAATLLAAKPAFAQDATAPETAVAAGDEGHGLGEIVVTAQRRRENLQDVPLSVTAVSGDTLAFVA